MEPKGPEVAKARMLATLRMGAGGGLLDYTYGGTIIPVQIVDCTPNTGFLPVYANPILSDTDITNDPGDDDGSTITIVDAGVYDVYGSMGGELDTIGKYYIGAAGADLLVYVPCPAYVFNRFSFSAYLKSGETVSSVNYAGMATAKNWFTFISAIPRSL